MIISYKFVQILNEYAHTHTHTYTHLHMYGKLEKVIRHAPFMKHNTVQLNMLQ